MESHNDSFAGAGGSSNPDCEQPLLPQRREILFQSQGSIMAIACVPSITLVNCFLGGIITIAIPDIAIELGISPELELWQVMMMNSGESVQPYSCQV